MALALHSATAMKLRKLLASIGASASVSVAVSGCCIQDGWWEDQSFALSKITDARFTQEVERCRADASDCDAICSIHWTYFSTDNPEGDADTRNCQRDGDTVRYEGYATCVAGRRPARHAAPRVTGDVVGVYFATQTLLEAASVRAFADLLGDLAHYGAPRSLRVATIRAAADEVRHARICHMLARRHGVSVAVSATPAGSRRTLRELAVDNAVEGCIRETYGAVIATHQARTASDPAVRAAMSVIAYDEAMHAQLAWHVHRWLLPQLDAEARHELVDRARAARTQLADAPDPSLVTIAGLPDAATQRHLVARLDAEVWSPADDHHAARRRA